MTGKKFKFRIDSEGKSGIKEVVTKSKGVGCNRIDISLATTLEFNLPTLNIFKDNIMIPLSKEENGENQKRSRGKSALYYPIESVSYICTVTLFMKGNQIKNKKLTIYIPKYIISEDELYCERATGSFTKEEREEIIDKLLVFAKSRI